MKKKFIIEIETDNMAPVYDDSGIETKEHEQEGFFEEQIITGIKLWIKEQLQDEFLNSAILDGLIPDFEFQGVPSWKDLSQYGTIKITLKDDGDEEVVCFFQREKIPVDEEYEEYEPIPKEEKEVVELEEEYNEEEPAEDELEEADNEEIYR